LRGPDEELTAEEVEFVRVMVHKATREAERFRDAFGDTAEGFLTAMLALSILKKRHGAMYLAADKGIELVAAWLAAGKPENLEQITEHMIMSVPPNTEKIQ